jgi:hypothetical protein
MRFAIWTYRLAAIYGVIVLAPLLFLRRQIEAQTGAFTHAEYFYGFLAVALVFQAVFFLISREPARLRPIMPLTVVEKWSWGAVVWIAWLHGQTQGQVVGFATADMAIGVLFALAWLKTPKT